MIWDHIFMMDGMLWVVKMNMVDNFLLLKDVCKGKNCKNQSFKQWSLSR